MKCPICGETLRPGKKDPNYLLCYNCRKKFKASQKTELSQEEEPSQRRETSQKKEPSQKKKSSREAESTQKKKSSREAESTQKKKSSQEAGTAPKKKSSQGTGAVPKKKSSQESGVQQKKKTSQKPVQKKPVDDDFEFEYEEEEQEYSNIPPKAVREKREREMRQAYDDLLAVESANKKGRKQKEYDEDDLYDDDEGVSKIPIIILAIAIIAVAAVIAYMMFF